jgi:hypothetical protein
MDLIEEIVEKQQDLLKNQNREIFRLFLICFSPGFRDAEKKEQHERGTEEKKRKRDPEDSEVDRTQIKSFP